MTQHPCFIPYSIFGCSCSFHVCVIAGVGVYFLSIMHQVFMLFVHHASSLWYLFFFIFITAWLIWQPILSMLCSTWFLCLLLVLFSRKLGLKFQGLLPGMWPSSLRYIGLLFFVTFGHCLLGSEHFIMVKCLWMETFSIGNCA